MQRIQEISSPFSVISTPGICYRLPSLIPVCYFWFSSSVVPLLFLICISLLFLPLVLVKILFCILPSYYRINAFFCCIRLLSLRVSSLCTPSHASRNPCVSLFFAPDLLHDLQFFWYFLLNIFHSPVASYTG